MRFFSSKNINAVLLAAILCSLIGSALCQILGGPVAVSVSFSVLGLILCAGAVVLHMQTRSVADSLAAVLRTPGRAQQSPSKAKGQDGLVDSVKHLIDDTRAQVDQLQKELSDRTLQSRLLVRQKQNADQIIYEIKDAVVVVDDFQRVTIANASARKLFGFEIESDTLKPLKELVDHSEFITLVNKSCNNKLAHVRHELTVQCNGEPSTFDCVLSCLTDEKFFGGKLGYIHRIKAAVPLPVLRKDFLIDPYQLWQSRASGADAILLIAECLTEAQIVDMLILAQQLQLTVLLEVHSMDNLLRVRPHVGFPHPAYCLLGINNRDLDTMTVDLGHTLRLVDLVDDRSVLVSESGIKTPADLARLAEENVRTVLVGEHLMKQPSPGNALAELLGSEPVEG